MAEPWKTMASLIPPPEEGWTGWYTVSPGVGWMILLSFDHGEKWPTNLESWERLLLLVMKMINEARDQSPAPTAEQGTGGKSLPHFFLMFLWFPFTKVTWEKRFKSLFGKDNLQNLNSNTSLCYRAKAVPAATQLAYAAKQIFSPVFSHPAEWQQLP